MVMDILAFPFIIFYFKYRAIVLESTNLSIRYYYNSAVTNDCDRGLNAINYWHDLTLLFLITCSLACFMLIKLTEHCTFL